MTAPAVTLENEASTADQNKYKVLEAYRLAMAGDWDGFYRDFDPNVNLIEPESLPYGGNYHGIANTKFAVNAAIATWDDFAFEIEHVAAAGDLVFGYVHVRGTGKKTGKTFSFPLVETWRFRDGKVVEFRPFYWDTHKVRDCFGD